MPSSVSFQASRDRVTVLVSLGILAVVIVVGAIPVYVAITDASAGVRVLMVVLATSLAILIAAIAAFVPLGYAVTDEAVVIRRPIRTIRIPLTRVGEARRVELTRIVRVFGVGGFFGAWGRFTSKQLDSFRAYVTQRGNLLCLHLKDGDPVVLSPDDPDGMIAEIRRRCGTATKGTPVDRN
jgi:hypothetical protein